MDVIDRREPGVVGRRSRVELTFRASGGRTILAHAYAEPPMRVARALPWGDGVHVIITSSAPGLFGGDALDQRVCLETGARVLLTSQSALQVHPSFTNGTVSVRGTYDVADDAELVCHWDPVIPFAGSRLQQHLAIRLAPSARVLWSDAFMAGRAGRGERWQFDRLHHELGVTRRGRLEYLERMRLQPREDALGGRWTAGDASYFGTVIASGWPVGEAEAEQLDREVGIDRTLWAAVDRVEPGLLVARLAGSYGPAFHEARSTLRRAFEPAPHPGLAG